MVTKSHLAELRKHFRSILDGPIDFEQDIRGLFLLREAWDELRRDDTSSLASWKLDGERLENLRWQDPQITFSIERHGSIVNGSTRADVHDWIVDLEKGKAWIEDGSIRQLSPRAKRLDTKILAAEIMELIVQNITHKQVSKTQEGWFQVNLKEIGELSSGPKKTIQGRRKRFRKDLKDLVDEANWVIKERGTRNYYGPKTLQ